jgi:hypothetical protein
MDTARSRLIASAGPWDFFVSYTRVDEGWAEWIAWHLEDAGYRVLFQAWDMVPGSNWSVKMQDGITHADRTIAVLSKAYLGSVYGRQEWQSATLADPAGIHRKLVPIRIEDCDRPGLLGQVVSFDLFGLTPADAQDRLLANVKGTIAGRAKPAREPAFPGGPASPIDSSKASGSNRRSAIERSATTTRQRATMLATWNPGKWRWDDYADAVQASHAGHILHEPWSTGRRKSGIEPGDRVYLLLQGDGPRGIIGSGTCASSIFQDDHWDDESLDDEANWVLVDWDTFVLPEDALDRTVLIDQIPAGNGWRPQASGTVLDAGAAAALEQMWARHVEKKVAVASSTSPGQRPDPRRDGRRKVENAIFDREAAQRDETQTRNSKGVRGRLFRRPSR